MLGRGFDLAIPAIVIDTRFGLPNYDGRARYSLEGEDLLTRPTMGRLIPLCHAQKAFRKIRHYRSSWRRTIGS